MAEYSDNSSTRILSNAHYFAEVQHMLDEGKEVRIRIKGNSMRPFIADGDTVLLKAYKGEVLPLGINVLARHQGKYVFHRYVGTKDYKIILAGDGNLVLCEFVDRIDIMATAIQYFPQNQSKPIDLNSRWYRLRGMIWYRLRLLRRIIAKLKR